jgi:hypothetical protein
MMRQSETDAEVSYSALDELRQKLEQRLRDTLGRYELAETRWNVTFSEIPQIDLYNDALNRYFAHLENVYRFKREELDRESEYLARARENDLEIDRFKKYGELIEQYPELLKYFYIQRFSEQADVLVLPQNESTGFPKMLEPWEQLDKKPAPEQRPASPPVEPKEEEFPQPEEQLDEAERTIEGTDTEEDETGKWYDPLMFWKREKGDG